MGWRRAAFNCLKAITEYAAAEFAEMARSSRASSEIPRPLFLQSSRQAWRGRFGLFRRSRIGGFGRTPATRALLQNRFA